MVTRLQQGLWTGHTYNHNTKEFHRGDMNHLFPLGFTTFEAGMKIIKGQVLFKKMASLNLGPKGTYVVVETDHCRKVFAFI